MLTPMHGLPSRAWHAVPAEDAVRELVSDAHAGLFAAEAAARLARFGANIITARKGRPWWLRFLLQFHAPLVYILLVAGAVMLPLGDHVDSAVIFGVARGARCGYWLFAGT